MSTAWTGVTSGARDGRSTHCLHGGYASCSWNAACSNSILESPPDAALDDLDPQKIAEYVTGFWFAQFRNARKRFYYAAAVFGEIAGVYSIPHTPRSAALWARPSALAAECHPPGGAFHWCGFHRPVHQARDHRHSSGAASPGGGFLARQPAQRSAVGGTYPPGNARIPVRSGERAAGQCYCPPRLQHAGRLYPPAHLRRPAGGAFARRAARAR